MKPIKEFDPEELDFLSVVLSFMKSTYEEDGMVSVPYRPPGLPEDQVQDMINRIDDHLTQHEEEQ